MIIYKKALKLRLKFHRIPFEFSEVQNIFYFLKKYWKIQGEEK